MNENIKVSQYEDKRPGILGYFEGECADSNVTNANGLDITREVWERVFESEDYKKGIANRWFIGYAGHPEDPGYDNPAEAVIVMTEGHIADNGKVYGKFDLMDTPVGRVYKVLIDAGMKPGISVRGAGDIIDNSVDPEGFIFRGFDLVIFPAYDNSVPTFHEIAASTKIEDQRKYKKICAAVQKEVSNITSCEALEQIQTGFAKNSDTYQLLEDRKCELSKEEDDPEDKDAVIALLEDKVKAVTELYVNKCAELEQKVRECTTLSEQCCNLDAELTACKTYAARKLSAVNRITSSQIADISAKAKHNESRIATLISANTKLKAEAEKLQKQNLSYLQKAKVNGSVIADKDAKIADLDARLNETVNEANASKNQASNLGVKVKNLESEITASKKLLSEFQEAYAHLYAHAVGADSTNVRITASTNVNDIQSAVRGSALSRSSVFSTTSIDYQDVDVLDELADGDIVTL